MFSSTRPRQFPALAFLDKVNLEEIKELVHKEYNNTVHFTDLAAAEQYFESLKIEQQETAS